MNKITNRNYSQKLANRAEIVRSLEFASEQIFSAERKCRSSHRFDDAVAACYATRSAWLLIVQLERRQPGCISHDLIARVQAGINAAIGAVKEIDVATEKQVKIRRLREEFVGNMTLRTCLLEKLKANGIQEVDYLLVLQRLSPETDWVGEI